MTTTGIGPRRRTIRNNRLRFLGVVVIVVGALGPFFARPVLQPVRAFSSSSSSPSSITSRTDSNGFGGAINAGNDIDNAKPTIRVVPMAVSAPDHDSSGSNDGGDPPVLTKDVAGLADLRYDEWMSSSMRPPPSRYAFRMATAEIAAERAEAGAVTFLARQHTRARESGGAIVGAAELSPIEFEGTQPCRGEADPRPNDQNHVSLYVTDVVTSSKHRRMGIANRLMDALEHYAYETFASGKGKESENENDTSVVTLYLHVKPDNPSARSFYANPERGYGEPPSTLPFDTALLEDNAGIETGKQILLCKTLTRATHREAAVRLERQLASSPRGNGAETTTTTSAQGFGGGFGGSNHKAKKKPKRKKR